jgi:signal transduction histidine kinase
MLGQEEERRRIARELHDHLNQQLALLAIDLQQLGANPPASSAALSSALADAWRRTTEIASDVHGISHRLHPSKLEALGLVATIRAHCRDVSRQNLAVHFTEDNVPEGIPSDVALCLFRVLEEALSNVASHSHASEAMVTLVNGDGRLTLRVSDSGHGFIVNSKPSRGLGLTSMRERLNALGGSLSITSAPGKGTVVEARVPLPVPAPEQQALGPEAAECG